MGTTSNSDKKEPKRLRVIVEPYLSGCIDHANELRVTDKEFLDIKQIGNSVALVYYR